jgi:hypothetical protein
MHCEYAPRRHPNIAPETVHGPSWTRLSPNRMKIVTKAQQPIRFGALALQAWTPKLSPWGLKGAGLAEVNSSRVNKLPNKNAWANFSLERKVRCDTQRPACGNCTKARRVCQGYGIQLSWPRDGDRKRARVSVDMPRAMTIRQRKTTRFLNSSSWDIWLSEELENGRTSGENHPGIHCQAASY